MSIDTQFGNLMFEMAKEDLKRAVGADVAKVLLERHMDVVIHGGSAMLHWVKYPGLFEEDLWTEERSSALGAARSDAILFLLSKLGFDELEGE